MLPYQIIEKKAAGEILSEAEIEFIVRGFSEGSIPDYQMSALLMAIFLKGMDPNETLILTRCMLESGEQMDFSEAPGFVADKHSTGGVGDKVSLLLAPILACLGMHIPMISGRGLGHSGGTLDKLESIPGFKVNLTLDRWRELVLKEGVGLIGQGEAICPADKKLYALRDVTATVRSIPLISASIMSKKIAEGIQGLVLDVKTGNGAFMQTLEQSRALAKSLVSIGEGYGIKTQAVITDMNQPLGYAIGNWLEMEESIQGLQGNGPRDLMEITYELGSQALMMADGELSRDGALKAQQDAVNSGRAFEKLLRIVEFQGGDPRLLENPESYPGTAFSKTVFAKTPGYIREINTMKLGFACINLGAGRRVMSDGIDYGSGMKLACKLGERVEVGDPLVHLFSERESAIMEMAETIGEAFQIGENQLDLPPLIYTADRIN